MDLVIKEEKGGEPIIIIADNSDTKHGRRKKQFPRVGQSLGLLLVPLGRRHKLLLRVVRTWHRPSFPQNVLYIRVRDTTFISLKGHVPFKHGWNKEGMRD